MIYAILCTSIPARRNIGICADIASMLTPESSVSAMKCFQGCPYTNTAFDFDLRFDGEKKSSCENTKIPLTKLPHASKIYPVQNVWV